VVTQQGRLSWRPLSFQSVEIHNVKFALAPKSLNDPFFVSTLGRRRFCHFQHATQLDAQYSRVKFMDFHVALSERVVNVSAHCNTLDVASKWR
jgi:hypothetical protein